MIKQRTSNRLAEMRDRVLKEADGDIDKASALLRSEIERTGDTALVMEIIGLNAYTDRIEDFLKDAIGPEFEEAMQAVRAKGRSH